MFAARSLTIVAAAHDSVAVGSLQLLRSLAVGAVYHVKSELGDLWDVAPEGQHPGACRHDCIRGYIITHLKEHRQFEPVGQSIERREGGDIRTFLQRYALCFLDGK